MDFMVAVWLGIISYALLIVGIGLVGLCTTYLFYKLCKENGNYRNGRDFYIENFECV